MEAITAVLCDFAADYQGKLCVIGAFDTILVRTFPAAHPQCTVALRLLLREEDRGEHRIQVLFADADGRPLIPTENSPDVTFNLPALPPESYFLSQNFVFHFQGLPLPQPGLFEVRIVVDGHRLSTLPLQIVQAPNRDS
jgi:hypothetical protein